MVAILVLSIPPLFLMWIRNKVLALKMTKKQSVVCYLIMAVGLHYLMALILLFGFRNTGNLFYKLNTYYGFALKYFVLSLVLAVMEPFMERVAQKKLEPANNWGGAKLRKRIYHFK